MKKLFVLASCMLFFSMLLPGKINAQTLSAEDIKAQLIKEWERAKTYTVQYLNAMPTDKYGLKPVDSIRSFAQQMLHLSEGNLYLMGQATDQTAPAWGQSNLEKSATAQSKDSVMYYVTASYDYCISAIKNTDVSKWGEKKKMFGQEATRFALLLKAFEHQTHHRGQTTIYIRLAGIRPPQEMLF